MNLNGHKSSINDVYFSPGGNLAITGSADKTIKIWQVDGKDLNGNEIERKNNEIIQIDPIGTLEGHKLGVNSIVWSKNGSLLYSGSDDHNIIVWDITEARMVSSIQGSKVITSIDYNDTNGLLITSQPDFTVKLWDPRSNDTKPTTFKSHKGWVRKLKWSPNETSYQFVSCSDDNTIKIFDIRSTIPLHTISHNTDNVERLQPHKVISVGWRFELNKKK